MHYSLLFEALIQGLVSTNGGTGGKRQFFLTRPAKVNHTNDVKRASGYTPSG
jgi:hypothetical protein